MKFIIFHQKAHKCKPAKRQAVTRCGKTCRTEKVKCNCLVTQYQHQRCETKQLKNYFQFKCKKYWMLYIFVQRIEKIIADCFALLVVPIP